MKRLVFVLMFFGLAATAQTLVLTNKLSFTNRFDNASARVVTAPVTTNDGWTVTLLMAATNTPGWTVNTNGVAVFWTVTARAQVDVNSGEIATNNGLTVSQVVNGAYFTVQTQAMNAALQKMIQNTIGR